MNWKNIAIVVLVGFSWMFFVSYFIAPPFYELGFIIVIINAIATCFIGSIIAGRSSPADAWKNGLGVGIFLFTVLSIVIFLFIILGYVDFPPYNYQNFTEVIGDLIITLIIYATTGTIGGFIGGKIRRELVNSVKMVEDGEKTIDRSVAILIRWKVWAKRFYILLWLGGIIFGLGVGAGLLLSIAAVGAGYPTRRVDFSPLTDIAGIAMVLGVLLFFIGVVTFGITTIGYNVQKRIILRSKEKEEEVVTSLISQVLNKNYGKYAAIICILGDIRNKRAAAPVASALKDDDAEVRQASAEALGSIGDVKAVEPLIQTLKDKNVHVRSVTARSLNQLGWKPRDDTEKAYYLIAKEQWDDLRGLGKAAIYPLIETLKDESNGVRKGAIETLGKIGDERAVEPLIETLNDENNNVRKKVVEALEKIGGERVIEPITRASKDKDGEVRKAAKEALERIQKKKS